MKKNKSRRLRNDARQARIDAIRVSLEVLTNEAHYFVRIGNNEMAEHCVKAIQELLPLHNYFKSEI